jgi:hypothetical protein
VQDAEIIARLERRLGAVHARQRLGIEADHEAQCFGQGLNFLHIENWYSVHSVIRNSLRAVGLYGRGLQNAGRVQLRRTAIRLAGLPRAFHGFTILHLSDLHADTSTTAMDRLIELLPELRYDLCALTGDYRGKTFGPFTAAIDGMARIRKRLAGPIYGVLGNHDTIRMVPALEDMGVRVLLNEADTLERAASASISRASTTPTSFASTISRKLRPTSLATSAHSCSRIRPRYSVRPRMPASTCFWPGTPMAARSVCPAVYRSRSIRTCRGRLALVRGDTAR